MATAAEQRFFNNAINTVFRDDKDDLIHALKFLNQNSDNIPLLLAKLDKLCGCSFSDKAGLQNNPAPQAVADSISIAVTAAGGTPSDAVALKRKVGSAELETSEKDLSGAVNGINSRINNALLNTIGSDTLTTEATTVKGAINELAASGGGTYTPVGTLGSFYESNSAGSIYTLIATGSTDLATHMQAWQKCANWAKGKLDFDSDGDGSVDSYRDDGVMYVYFSLSDGGTVFNIYSYIGGFLPGAGPGAGSLESLCKWALDH